MSDEEMVHTEVELYDHDRVALNAVFARLSAAIGQHRELSSFQREARERLAEVGFVARCDFYHDEEEDHLPEDERTNYPRITILDRCEPTAAGSFDHDRMGHEVRSNVLGVKGQDNVQKTQVQGGFTSRKSGLITPN